MKHATNSLTKYPLLDELNKKAADLCCDGAHCYSAVPKCLAGCGFTKHCDVRIDQSGSTVIDKHCNRQTSISTRKFSMDQR